MSLLETAQKVEVKGKKATGVLPWDMASYPDKLELCLAYLNGELSMKQFVVAARGDYESTNTMTKIGPVIREAVSRGIIEINQLPTDPTKEDINGK